MNDEDMICRGDAFEAITKCKYRTDVNIAAAINDIPAQHPTVQPLEWEDFDGWGAKAKAWGAANYMIQKCSDGRWELGASHPGYGTTIDGVERLHNTLEAAKAAAQAHWEAETFAAITMQPAPDVSALTAERDKLRATSCARVAELEADLTKAVEAVTYEYARLEAMFVLRGMKR